MNVFVCVYIVPRDYSWDQLYCVNIRYIASIIRSSIHRSHCNFTETHNFRKTLIGIQKIICLNILTRYTGTLNYTEVKKKNVYKTIFSINTILRSNTRLIARLITKILAWENSVENRGHVVVVVCASNCNSHRFFFYIIFITPL